MTKECQGIGSAELLKQVGITFRQLDHWCRVGYIQPHNHQGKEGGNPGSGIKRCWAPAEVTKVQLFRELIGAGLDHEPAWELLQDPSRIRHWVSELAALHYQLTGESIVLETVSSTPVDNPVGAA